jgi:hypothetical protein
MSERPDEIAECVGGQRPIDPAVPFSQVCVVILRAQHDLKGPGAARQAHEVLNAAPTRDRSKPRLRLSENRRLSRGKAHVARQYELAAGGAYATLDLRDSDEAACAQVAKQEGDLGFSGQLRCLRPVFLDPGHVDVGNEVVGISALEHQHLENLVGFGLLNEGNQIADQLWPQKIHGRSRNFSEQNGPFLAHGERFENFSLGTFGGFNRIH